MKNSQNKGHTKISKSTVMFLASEFLEKYSPLSKVIYICSSLYVFPVPVVLKTWAKETDNLEFYSEIEDKSIPTIDLGVPNTERGKQARSISDMFCI